MKIIHWFCLGTLLSLVACAERAKNDDVPESARPPTAEAAPTGPAAPTDPAGAVAQLNPTQGNQVTGLLNVMDHGTGVHLAGSLQGLAPNGEFGFHIHENGDCSAPDASSAGEHFNPNQAQHGNPAGDAHHAGDIPNVKSDAQGVAKVDAMLTGVTLSNGTPTDVMRRAVVVHEKADDYSSQPAGNSGARLACGVISANVPATPVSPSSP